MLSVIAVKNGTKYGPEYVNRLFWAVKRHLSVEHEFICLTDNPKGLHHEIEVERDESGLPGWWAKMRLFDVNSPMRSEHNRVLFFDLDTIIVDSIDFMAQYTGPFAILRDFYRPDGYGSGVMILGENFGQHIWDRFAANAQYTINTLHGDQNFIERTYRGAERLQDLFPGKFVSYKVHCQKSVPKDASVVCFHGVPKQSDLPLEHELTKAWLN